MKKNIQKQVMLRKRITSIVFTVLFLVLSTVFIYSPSKDNLLASFNFLNGREKFYIQELSDGIKIANANPVSDQEGTNSDGFKFKVVNNTNKDKQFRILFSNQFNKLKERNLEALDAKYLRYNMVDIDNNYEYTNELESNFIVYEGIIRANSSNTFEFRVWLGENFDEDAIGKTFIGQMSIEEF